jgi:hypothetical protein
MNVHINHHVIELWRTTPNAGSADALSASNGTETRTATGSAGFWFLATHATTHVIPTVLLVSADDAADVKRREHHLFQRL